MERPSAQRRKSIVIGLTLIGVATGVLAVWAWWGTRNPSTELLATLAQVNVGLVIALVVETRPRSSGSADTAAFVGYGTLSFTLLLAIALLALADFLPERFV